MEHKIISFNWTSYFSFKSAQTVDIFSYKMAVPEEEAGPENDMILYFRTFPACL